MKQLLSLVTSLLVVCSFISCNGLKQQSAEGEGDTIRLRYAQNLTMVKYEDYTLVTLRDPWDTTKVLHRYALVEKPTAQTDTHGNSYSEEISNFKQEGVTIVPVPLQKAAVFSAVHCSLFRELGAASSVKGVTDVPYIQQAFVKKGLKDGTIVDLGNGMDPNLERIMQLQPDALMPSPFQNSGGYGRLERIGIPIIECADYMEVSPLARAEWVKFYGRLLGKPQEADRLFATIEKQYTSLREKASHVKNRPTLMVEQLTAAAWYTPGGQSTMGILYHDAGAHYLWEDTPESGSLSLSLEAVMERALDADYWLMKYNQPTPLTYDQLAKDNTTYTKFKAFREHHIFACNTNPTAYFEETPFHPERLLANLLQIFHPELSISAEKQYFCPVNEK